MQFTDNVLTTSGDNAKDLWVFEIGSAIEPTNVFISTDAVNWIAVGSVNGSTSGIDIDSFIGFGVTLGESYSFVKVVDLLPHQSGFPYTGADIDAIGTISYVSPVPEPSTILLLGSGLVVLMGFNYRRRKEVA